MNESQKFCFGGVTDIWGSRGGGGIEGLWESILGVGGL